MIVSVIYTTQVYSLKNKYLKSKTLKTRAIEYTNIDVYKPIFD